MSNTYLCRHMEIGQINKLKVEKVTDIGCYLIDDDKNEVLLPTTLISKNYSSGDHINVFVYKDLDDRTVATTIKPGILLDQFAFLKVTQTKKGDVFMDWGMPDDLLVPLAEQSQKMLVENWYLIFLLKDEETGNLIGSNKVNDFVFFRFFWKPLLIHPMKTRKSPAGCETNLNPEETP